MKKNPLTTILRTLCLTALLGLYSVNTYPYEVWDTGAIDVVTIPGESNRNILVVGKDANEEWLACGAGTAVIILPGVMVTITKKFTNEGSIYVFGTLNSKVELLGVGTIYVMKDGSFNYTGGTDEQQISTGVELSDVLEGKLVSGQLPTKSEEGWKDYWEGRIVCEDDFYPMGYYEDKACTKKIDDLEEWKKDDGKVSFEKYKELALAAIQTAMDGETSDYLTGLVQSYINTINSADNTAIIDEAKAAAVAILTAAMPTYKTIKAEGKEEALGGFGSMLTPHSGPTINVVSNDGTKVKLYNVKGVEYKK